MDNKKKMKPKDQDHRSQQKNPQDKSSGVDPIHKKVMDHRSVQIKQNKEEAKAKSKIDPPKAAPPKTTKSAPKKPNKPTEPRKK